jgi:hypothetical protein
MFLLGIALQPFTTSVVSRYGAEPVAMMLYAGLLAATRFVLTLIWVYALANRRLVDSALDVQVVRFYTLRMLIPTLIFLASAGLAPVVPSGWVPWVPLAWLLVIPVPHILRRRR